MLGAGGMGVVYLALDETLRRQVAVKVTSALLGDDLQARPRFLREARAMAAVEHPNVVRVYSFGESEGRPYLVMEYVRGESLAQRIRRGPIAEGEVRRVARQVVLALQAAWQQHLVHRDIKPSNILLDEQGQVRVADFGLAKPLESSEPSTELTGTQVVVGTLHYVAPEQARGLPVDFRADVYALGVLLFEMLVGERPFRASTPFDLLEMQVHQPLPSIRARRPDTSEAMERLVRWMTQKDPQARPGSYDALLAALDEGSSHRPLTDEAAEAKGTPATKRLCLRLVAAASLAAFAIGLAAWRSTHWTKALAGPPARSPVLVVAVTPFYGPDPDSAREGRVVASLVERAVVERSSARDIRVVGIEETAEPARSHEAARELGLRLGASLVVWGRALAYRGETEIQSSFTVIPPRVRSPEGQTPELIDVARRQPGMPLEQQAQALVMTDQSSSQIELRKTSAQGVADRALLLASRHALYNERAPARALRILERAPGTPEAMRLRAQGLFAQRSDQAAFAALREALALDPSDRPSQALLGDLYQVAGRFADALATYQQAVGPDGVIPGAGFVVDDLIYIRELAAGAHSYGDRLVATGYLIGIDPRRVQVRARHRLPGLLVSVTRTEGGFSLGYLPAGERENTASIRFVSGRPDRPVVHGSSPGLRRLLEVSSDTRRAVLAGSEAALREACERDATNAWWPFFLGTALWNQDRKNEAARLWESVVAAGAFPAMGYYDLAAMADRLERMGLREWADRAYGSALARRRSLPQPIESTFWLDRAVSARFGSRVWEPGSGDAERRHVLLERARELTGVGLEEDAFLALAWESYFRARGDAQRAGREAAWLERVRQNPLEATRLAASLDYALYLMIATVGAAWALLACLVLPGRDEPPGSARWSPRALLARPSREQRVALVMAGLLSLLAAGWAVRLGAHVATLVSMPFGINDSLGDEAWIRWFEGRLSREDTPSLRWAAAVAHHLGGNVSRARELYRRLPGEARARENLAALERGNLTPPHPLTAKDIHAATYGSRWRAPAVGLGWILLFRASEPQLADVLVGVRWAVWPPVLLAVAWLASWRSIPRTRVRETGPGGRLAWGELVIPGVRDVRSGRAVRGLLVFLMLAFVVAVALHRAIAVNPAAPGLSTEASSFVRLSPLPPEGLSPWTRALGYPHARTFWTLVAVSVLAVPALHVVALRSRRRQAPRQAQSAVVER